MRVGVIREIKPGEHRVALTAAGARTLAEDGHEVLVESGAGLGAGLPDDSYRDAGARLADAQTVWAESELLLKVKEPIGPEYGLLHADQVLFTYLHLAPNPGLTEALLRSGVTAVAYETVTDGPGQLPLLAPMSEIAGRLATQAGAYFLQDPLGGAGVLIGGAAGVAPARVLVIGGGVVGTHAARVAVGMGAEVTILERSLARIRQLEEQFQTTAQVLMSDPLLLRDQLVRADLVIGAVLLPGARAPHVIDREMLATLPRRAVIVDVAIDQGGCVETSHPTTHEDPVFAVDEVLHYCVANMPGGVPVTSTRALTNATLPYVQQIAKLGIDGAAATDPGLAKGVNVREGEILYPPVAEAYSAAAVAA